METTQKLNTPPYATKMTIWLYGSVFVYKGSSCGFESCCSHLKMKRVAQKIWIFYIKLSACNAPG